jgi:hypothetical protein
MNSFPKFLPGGKKLKLVGGGGRGGCDFNFKKVLFIIFIINYSNILN